MKIESIVSDRKLVVKALEKATGTQATYLGAPSFGYEIGPYTVDRVGSITVEEMDPDVIAFLVAKGIITEREEAADTIVSIPLERHDGRSLKNLVFLLHSKSRLLSKAVGKPGFYSVSESLIAELDARGQLTTEEFLQVVKNNGKGSIVGISFEEEKIGFHFPHTTEPDRIQVFMQLSELMVKMAREQSRVKPEKSKETNEKYTFRVWLLRLGMKGEEYKTARMLLLNNLKGHAAFRTKDQAEAAKEKLRQRRAAEVEAAREFAFVEL